MENEFEYYTRRAAEERRAAAQASSPEAEQRHLALAERYVLAAEEWQKQPSRRRASSAGLQQIRS